MSRTSSKNKKIAEQAKKQTGTDIMSVRQKIKHAGGAKGDSPNT